MIRTTIEADIKTAMKAGEKEKLGTLRMLLSAIKDFQINERTEPTDADVLRILRKASKSRRDAIEEFKKGGRMDLVAKEESEISIIELYLPAEMDEAAIAKVVDEIVVSTGATGMKEMGRVMKEVMARLGGGADGGVVNGIVKRRLSA